MRFQAFTLFFVAILAQYQDVADRHSFNPPFSQNSFKAWRGSSGIKVTTNKIQLTPHGDLAHGSIWNSARSTMTDWEISYRFDALHLGTEYPKMGQGIALWYVERPGLFGPVYGSADYWKGLGIFVAVSPPEKNQLHGNLIITSLFNDGTKQFTALAYDDLNRSQGCVKPLRDNWTNATFALRVRYQDEKLSLSVSQGADSLNFDSSSQCFDTPMVLGVDKYIGLSAHTAQPKEHYNVKWLTTRDLSPSHDAANIEAARQSYKEKIGAEIRSHGDANGLDTDTGKFRRAVMGILKQLQDGQSVLDDSQEHLHEYIGKMLGRKSNVNQKAEDMTRISYFFDQLQQKTQLDHQRLADQLDRQMQVVTELLHKQRGRQRTQSSGSGTDHTLFQGASEPIPTQSWSWWTWISITFVFTSALCTTLYFLWKTKNKKIEYKRV